MQSNRFEKSFLYVIIKSTVLEAYFNYEISKVCF